MHPRKAAKHRLPPRRAATRDAHRKNRMRPEPARVAGPLPTWQQDPYAALLRKTASHRLPPCRPALLDRHAKTACNVSLLLLHPQRARPADNGISAPLPAGGRGQAPQPRSGAPQAPGLRSVSRRRTIGPAVRRPRTEASGNLKTRCNVNAPKPQTRRRPRHDPRQSSRARRSRRRCGAAQSGPNAT